MRKQIVNYDVVVCGGGLAGLSAAVAAARQGARTVIVQDRPVFGGNSSSEIRVTPHGAARFHAYARETGVISELAIEDRATNHEQFYNNGWTNAVWDMTMYDLAVRTPNLTISLNTSITDVQKADDRTISAVVGRIANAETEIVFKGKVFLDCTGDGIVADLAGNEWRMGSEGRGEFGEPHAPEHESKDTMGSSIHFRAKDMGRAVPFQAPEWAVTYDDPAFFYGHNRKPYDIRAGYWWFELGTPWDTIYDNEVIRHELTRHVLGVWDWIKNKDPNTREAAANYALDWIGQVPGKRESRRIMGRYLMTEHDALNRTVFPDEVAFGGWYLDLHIPGGLLAPTSDLPGMGEYCGPYGIPLRILIAKDIDNLLMAGRNVSVTHAALGSVRVMATTAIMGQAAGTAAAVALKRSMNVPEVNEKAIGDVQQILLREGCFLPNVRNEDPRDLALQASVTASSEALLFSSGEPSFDGDYLDVRRGQWIAVDQELRSISVCLTNVSKQTQYVDALLVPVEHIWDYRCLDGEAFAANCLEVPPGQATWIEWPVQGTLDKTSKASGYIRLDLQANRSVIWHRAARILPGHPCALEGEEGTMKGCDDGHSMSFKVSPGQHAYPAAHVTSGVARPHRATNLWQSDPEQSMPQWLELTWETTQQIGRIELTFPGHLLQDFNKYAAYYRDPDCPKDYRIEGWIDGEWKELFRVEGNYHRHVRHRLQTVIVTNRIRILIRATNGSPSAAVYEVRCYQDQGA
ncbi:FAD-dependent oxidoreductase [Paenibacillus sp. SI8]|uniref:FAD-dependent oxidoreductase n=1 Tax=unclassified Paenibacillus TaxID=185978 RepID=UPI00346605C8